MDEGIEEARAEAGSVESSPLSRDESLCATERRDEAGYGWRRIALGPWNRPSARLTGEQLKRKPEKW